MLKPTISYSDVERIARDGSPLLLQAMGRAFGLGPAERAALGRYGAGGIPGWTWGLLALSAGFVIGVRAYKRWPDRIPQIVQGA